MTTTNPCVRTFKVTTTADFAGLSFYTLCKLADVTSYAYPQFGIPGAIERGQFKGLLTLDALGNFLSFE